MRFQLQSSSTVPLLEDDKHALYIPSPSPKATGVCFVGLFVKRSDTTQGTNRKHPVITSHVYQVFLCELFVSLFRCFVDP